MGEEGLLQAIRAEPENDLVRLVHADWLEEHGGPLDQARAEFIRIQIRRSQGGAASDEEAFLAAREQELLQRHRAAWLGPLQELPQGWEFQRGFVQPVVHLDALSLLEHPRALDHEPIHTLWLRDPDSLLKEVLALPIAQRLITLDLRYNGLHAHHLDAFLDCPRLEHLRTLHAGHNALEDDGMLALAGSPALAGLTELNLATCGVGDQGLAVLASSPHLAGLTHLDLGFNRLGAEAGRVLARATAWTRLISLSLQRNSLGDAGASALARAENLSTLQELNLERNEITCSGATALANARGLQHLMELKLTSNEIDRLGGQALAQAPGLPRLVSLRLYGNPVDSDVATLRILAQSPILERGAIEAGYPSWILPMLRALGGGASELRLRERLRDRYIWDSNLTPLLCQADLAGVRVLDLGLNRISPDGARALANCPSLTSLARLDLGENEIGNEGLRSLANSPHLPALTALLVANNWIGAKGVEFLLGSPLASRLEELDLSNNVLHTAAGQLLSTSRALGQLQRLDVRGCGFSASMQGKLRKRFGSGLQV